jgi:two-component system, LytTR family, response regulator
MIRAIIADDEPPVRARLRSLIAAASDFELITECADGFQTVTAVETHSPDVLFLDVQMPGLDGLEVVDSLFEHPRPPLIVFVTAFEQYAVHAFDVEAIDYIVKPIEPERLARALDRIRTALLQGGVALPNTEAIARQLPAPHRFLTRLSVRTTNGFDVIPLSDVEWLEAADNYVRIHTSTRTQLMRARLGVLGARLDPSVFVRVHRSAVINLNALTNVKPKPHGELIACMRSGGEVQVSRTYSASLRDILQQRP